MSRLTIVLQANFMADAGLLVTGKIFSYLLSVNFYKIIEPTQAGKLYF